MTNEVLDIDGNAWCIMEYDACLGDPRTHAGFGKTIAEAEIAYKKALKPSVTGNIPKNTEVLICDKFPGIGCHETNITFIGYRHREKLLRIGMTNGKHYNYQDVPLDIWVRFLVSDNKGTYWAQEIKGEYRYYCVNGD